MLVLALSPAAGAHGDGTTLHLWKDHIKPMKVAGTINDPANPVDWTKLKGVPAGLADGLDFPIVIQGTAGLDVFGFNDAYLQVDRDQIQSRVSSGCAVGAAIRSIKKNGSVVCSTGPRAVSKRIENTGAMCNDYCTEGIVILSPGTWPSPQRSEWHRCPVRT